MTIVPRQSVVRFPHGFPPKSEDALSPESRAYTASAPTGLKRETYSANEVLMRDYLD